MFATLADVLGKTLPSDMAVDSFSMLPALQHPDHTEPIRPYILQQGFGGKRYLAVRQDNWKYLAHQGSGGNNYDRNPGLQQYRLPELAPSASGQLYNLSTDPGETTNLALEHPEVVSRLRTLLEQSISDGRSISR